MLVSCSSVWRWNICKRTTEGGLSPENTKETANLYSVRIKYRAATIEKKKSQSKKWRLFWKISSRKTSAAGNNPEISEPRIDLRAPRYYETCPSVLLLEGWTWGPGSEIQSQRTNKQDRRRWGRATHLPSEKKQKYLCSRITFSHYIHSTGTLSYL